MLNWFQSYGNFAEWVDCAYWWSCIGKGLPCSLRSRLVLMQDGTRNLLTYYSVSQVTELWQHQELDWAVYNEEAKILINRTGCKVARPELQYRPLGKGQDFFFFKAISKGGGVDPKVFCGIHTPRNRATTGSTQQWGSPSMHLH